MNVNFGFPLKQATEIAFKFFLIFMKINFEGTLEMLTVIKSKWLKWNGLFIYIGLINVFKCGILCEIDLYQWVMESFWFANQCKVILLLPVKVYFPCLCFLLLCGHCFFAFCHVIMLAAFS